MESFFAIAPHRIPIDTGIAHRIPLVSCAPTTGNCSKYDVPRLFLTAYYYKI
jgi:hypothetical protein